MNINIPTFEEIVALKPPNDMIWIFMIFVLMSILYYITAKRNSRPDRFISLSISCTFTGIVTILLFMNLNIPNSLIYIKLSFFSLYYVLFTFIIWLALIRRDVLKFVEL